MNIRDATDEDVERIRSIARNSLRESYTHFLGEETIDDAVENWYDDGFGEELGSEDFLVLVAEDDEGPIAFSQSEFVGEGQTEGQIRWIHVDPEARGGGTGVRLLARTRERLIEDGAENIRATVLEENEFGNEFYAENGFERAGTIEVDIAGKSHTENVFVEAEKRDEEAGWRALEPVESDGETIYVSYGEPARGSEAPFYTAYEGENGEDRYGWFCGNCDSLDNAMDAMGRIQCNACGNRRKATRWDASYL